MINISHILLLALVSIIIFWIFESINQKHNEKFQETELASDIDVPRITSEILHNPNVTSERTYNHLVESPNVRKLRTIPRTGNCPLKENDDDTKNYITKFLMGNGTGNCPRPTQSIKEFNKDFFKFRDYTFGNSSMTLDSVDKIANMYLDGNLGEARGYQGKKIRDIFDDLVQGPQLYERKCARIPQFDNTMHDGYDASFVSGMQLTRDNWVYDNENILNGGQIEKNLYANDPDASLMFPALK